MRNEPSTESQPEETLKTPSKHASAEGLFKTGANVVFHHVQDTGSAIFTATKGLAHQAAHDIDGKGLAGGVVAMSAGEAVGSAIGGMIGAVAGPGGAIVGAQIGAFAGGPWALVMDTTLLQTNQRDQPLWGQSSQKLFLPGEEPNGSGKPLAKPAVLLWVRPLAIQ